MALSKMLFDVALGSREKTNNIKKINKKINTFQKFPESLFSCMQSLPIMADYKSILRKHCIKTNPNFALELDALFQQSS
jgi:hypothetical protein